MIAKSLLVCGAMACAMGPVAAGQEDAHGYPQKVVKVVVPTGPGGPTTFSPASSRTDCRLRSRKA